MVSIDNSVISAHGDSELFDSLAGRLARVAEQLRGSAFPIAMDTDGSILSSLDRTAEVLRKLQQSVEQMRSSSVQGLTGPGQIDGAQEYERLEQATISYLRAIDELTGVIRSTSLQ